MTREIGWMFRPAVARKIGRCCRQHAPHLANASDDDVGVRLLLPRTDRDVDASLDEIGIAVGGDDLNAEVWIERAKCGQHRRYVDHRERQRTRNAQHALRRQRAVAHRVLGFGEFVQKRAAALQKLLPCFRQPLPSRVALDQPNRQPLFQRAQMPARGRVRHSQRFGGPGETAQFGRLGESLKLQLRVDLFNAFNHAQFNNPSGSVTSSLFGRVTTTREAARITQLSVSLSF